MKQAIPWALVAFFGAFFVFQYVGYERERAAARDLQTIEGQATILRDWLNLTDEQTQGYLDLRHAIVEKEREFAEYRLADAKAFLAAVEEDIPDDEKFHLLKERHLARLKEIKAEELDIWSRWIDTLSFEQRIKYLGKVFEHRPLDTSWYDRDFFDDLDGAEPVR